MDKIPNLLILLCAVAFTGCSIQQRTLMPGLHIERVKDVTVQSQPSCAVDEVASAAEAARADFRPEAQTEEVQDDAPGLRKNEVASRREHETVQLLIPRTIRPLETVPAWSELKVGAVRENTVDLDRETELTLVLLGAALLMWSYVPFSIIGYLIVFVASVLGAPLVHALIWGEKMDWGKTRLGRVALSLVLSGLVLTGAMALVADVLGLVF